MTIRVVVVDDQDLVRTGCVLVVRSQPDLRVVGEAADGFEALDVLATTPADVVLMDVRMPRLDGVEATRRLLARPGPAPKVIMLTTFDLDEHAFAALRAGASGFLLKDGTAEEMLTAIRTVHQGEAVIAPSTTRRLLDHIAPDLPGPATADPAAALTSREREVLLWLARGAANAEIAAGLFLSEGTVKIHVSRVLAKLGLCDRVHAVIWAYEHRLIRPGS
ncbi:MULTISPECIES: response regulator transcription factor [unclassified Crossiella]|uniref:response regulator n=1 Tax=unclassified Crossiella TaxID=2620835 RepID=UPI001FFF07D5|nr:MULTISPECIES: response regulator transcription factor [unclassified Crossiella]MCK2240699.1 response regulator transcription factor [Crossiella sp. S99.2]MCK2252850.1 response regulator transcription factor [Crossiella sp. S99.1]